MNPTVDVHGLGNDLVHTYSEEVQQGAAEVTAIKGVSKFNHFCMSNSASTYKNTNTIWLHKWTDGTCGKPYSHL